MLGPGLIVMLADSDAGSVITAAQSGARWGYRLLLLQFLPVPLLYLTQELAARLGLVSGLGFGEMVRHHHGRTASALVTGALLLSCFGALVTQMSGLAGVGQLLGVPVGICMPVLVVLVLAMFASGSYRAVQRVSICLGLFGLSFVYVAWKAHPDPHLMWTQLHQMPLGDPGYLYLVAANLGTSIMPWTVFYQQSALVGEGLTADELPVARADTWLGALLCQTMSAAIVIAAAAALGGGAAGAAASGAPRSLNQVTDIAAAFTLTEGTTVGHVVFACGLVGCAWVATIVVCLTAGWALGEARGQRPAAAAGPLRSPGLYAGFALMLAAGGALVASGVNLIRLSLATGVVNALLMPVVLGVLLSLARQHLPAPYRLQGAAFWVRAVLFGAASALGGGCRSGRRVRLTAFSANDRPSPACRASVRRGPGRLGRAGLRTPAPGRPGHAPTGTGRAR
jgi:Mn2+/Fe2+ NRAMP family transporter